MKALFASAAILGLTAGAALAAEGSVVGDWLVKDGYANIRIDNCGGKMWASSSGRRFREATTTKIQTLPKRNA